MEGVFMRLLLNLLKLMRLQAGVNNALAVLQALLTILANENCLGESACRLRCFL
jgi:hypothetical protein